MCFSEKGSYSFASILIFYSFYLGFDKNIWRLSVSGIFLALKDIIQGLLYRYYKNKEISRILGTLSWAHICYQPLFVNLFASYFDPTNIYWNYFFILFFIFGTYKLTTLSLLDIQDEPDCKNKNDDFCADYTGGYIGKYHIGYKFKGEEGMMDYMVMAMIIPAFFTKAWPLHMIWFFFVILLRVVYYKILYNQPLKIKNNKTTGKKTNQEGEGEYGAMWCLLSIFLWLPIVFFRKEIKKLLS